MKTHFAVAGVATISIVSAFAQSRFVTLVNGADSNSGPLTIASNEVGRIRCLIAVANSTAKVRVTKGAVSVNVSGATVGGLADRGDVPISGPASFELVPSLGSPTEAVAATIEITPAVFDVNHTVVLPQDTGASIVLEASTNLIQWAPAPPGFYTNRMGNMFFRIRAERILLPAAP